MAVQLLRPGQRAAHVLHAGGKRNAEAQVGNIGARVRIADRKHILDVLPNLSRALVDRCAKCRILGIVRLIHDRRRRNIASFYTLAAAGTDETGAIIVPIKQKIAVVRREQGLASLFID